MIIVTGAVAQENLLPEGERMAEAKPEILFPKEVIERRVRELAAQISRDYAGKELLIVGILNGAFIFMADLIRGLDVPCRVDFVRAASYGCGSVSSGEVRITKDLETPIAGRDVLIVEDIVDTGTHPFTAGGGSPGKAAGFASGLRLSRQNGAEKGALRSRLCGVHHPRPLRGRLRTRL